MSALTVRPVRSAREKHVFLTFPWRIYQHDPLWVPPLLPDWTERIDPKRGAFFKRGEAEFFIAWRDGQPVGTISAAEDREENEVRHARECVPRSCAFPGWPTPTCSARRGCPAR